MKIVFYLFAIVVVVSGIGYYYEQLNATSGQHPPSTLKTEKTKEQKLELIQKYCRGDDLKKLRKAQVIEGVEIAESAVCRPDTPYQVAAFVKGTDKISRHSLMQTNLALDAVLKSDDRDGDGDPDVIRIKLEVAELNGSTPDSQELTPSYHVAPEKRPGIWAFVPKLRGMATKSSLTSEANETLRLPSPAIRVEQGDTVEITLENTHYFPHSIHFHGVDHPFVTESGSGNDGVPFASEMGVLPGKKHTYVFKARRAGTDFYHCHVQTDKHLMMGLQGLFIVEENHPDNWVQTLNVGNGKVRHPSVETKLYYDAEYDLHYQSIDKELGQIIQTSHDPRLIAERMNRQYDITDSTEDYFLLNGHSFPMTLIDSMVVVEQDQKLKFRVLNGQPTPVALHFHGHKAKVTHFDGVPVRAENQITRDVFNIAPAQRIDVELLTTNDGLNSYGDGIWLFHDHSEKAITTDGISPGGNINMLAYSNYVNSEGIPQTKGMDLNLFFSPDYYAGKVPVWSGMGIADLLGQAGTVTPGYRQLMIMGGLIGLLCLLVTGLIMSLRSGRVRQ
ncbi:MAG: multicopper oxidase domain-containing protein [Gammaproteobacteria bacterium]|nr:multicopper oxidase domain-containing protein [Gammaproteobacteria bacterium]